MNYQDSVEGKRRFENKEVYKKTLDFQNEMKKHGIAWHNHFANECTIDFCCCEGDNVKKLHGNNGEIYPASEYKHYIPSYRTVIKEAFQELLDDCKNFKKHEQLELQKKINKILLNL